MNIYVDRVERGATLVITMVFLLILTIIGLAGMDVTGLEERMAGNMRDRNIAFQAAEAAVLEGENYLETQVILPAFDGSNGLYTLPANGDKTWEVVTWSSSSAVISYSGAGFDELSSSAAYIIEDLAAASASDSLEVGVPVDNKRYYRVTARATGLSNTTSVILQTVYKR
ncbi:PilX N-terminal domain-containing pilus assembly protein [Neptuniibacter pectenicola]|uniref:PilX N-terminal domain-containing pilus assembly protein n=1 Tax=Neptuniibacter pectenicola TaxID=1806669 RepID=A0ABU9TSM7_9GAMM